MSNDTFHHFGGRRQEIQNWTLPFIENISFWTSAKCRHSENVGKCWYSKKMFSVDFASIWLQRTCWLRYVFFVFFCKIDFQIFSKELGHVNRFSKWLCALMTKVAEAAKCGRGCWLSRVCSIFNYLNQSCPPGTQWNGKILNCPWILNIEESKILRNLYSGSQTLIDHLLEKRWYI